MSTILIRNFLVRVSQNLSVLALFFQGRQELICTCLVLFFDDVKLLVKRHLAVNITVSDILLGFVDIAGVYHAFMDIYLFILIDDWIADSVLSLRADLVICALNAFDSNHKNELRSGSKNGVADYISLEHLRDLLSNVQSKSHSLCVDLLGLT